MISKKQQLLGIVFMLLATIFWGTTFVAQSAGMDHLGPFTYNCCRSFVGCIVLIPIAIFYDRFNNKGVSSQAEGAPSVSSNKKNLIIGGIVCGVVLTVASGLQQIGIVYTSIGKTGFLTVLYIVIVPLLGLFLKKKCQLNVWISVIIAVVGLYLLCITENFSIVPTDLYVLGCAVMYAVHILVVDHYSPKVNGVWLSCIQFFVCGILSGVIMFIIETPTIENIIACAGPILYAGVFSSGVAFTLQILGQKYLDATLAALIMSMESVISVLSGWIFLHEMLSPREILGCVFVFIAVLLAQFAFPSKKAKKEARA